MSKSDAIRAVLRAAGKPLTMQQLLPRLEQRLRQVIGRQRLYTLLTVMQTNTGEIVTAGRADTRTYALRRGK